jgi:7 transmembrane receptor (rhodopsin family)
MAHSSLNNYFYRHLRFKRLRTPANVFIMNLTLSDLCACLLHPMASYSSFNGGWAFGRIGNANVFFSLAVSCAQVHFLGLCAQNWFISDNLCRP